MALGRPAADRILGILIFLPVPIVLWLYTRMPLGLLPSLLLGTAIMLTHPLYARPFALKRADRRCLWCGVALRPETAAGTALEAAREAAAMRQGVEQDDPPGAAPRLTRELSLQEPRGETHWSACCPRHEESLRRLFGYAQVYAMSLRIGILGSLVLLLVGAAKVWLRPAGLIVPADAVAVFRLGVALTVLPLGWFGPHFGRANPDALPLKPKTPFPVHIQALIGTLPVLWLFRLIGLLWLYQGFSYVVSRRF